MCHVCRYLPYRYAHTLITKLTSTSLWTQTTQQEQTCRRQTLPQRLQQTCLRLSQQHLQKSRQWLLQKSPHPLWVSRLLMHLQQSSAHCLYSQTPLIESGFCVITKLWYYEHIRNTRMLLIC